MEMPRPDAALPSRTEHRQFGSDLTTELSCVQHELDGVVSLPVMKLRHGDRFKSAEVHELDWPAAKATRLEMKRAIRVDWDPLRAIGGVWEAGRILSFEWWRRLQRLNGVFIQVA